MNKIDYKKQHKHLYYPSAQEVSLVEAPPQNFLMIDGMGDPTTSATFQAAVEALFAVSYALKFLIKKGEAALDYTVMPLEGLWWVDDNTVSGPEQRQLPREKWCWTMMIMQPAPVTPELFEEARQNVAKKKELVVLPQMRLEYLNEGSAAQIMHIGPFANEEATLAKLHGFFDEHGYSCVGKHHEIYLSDFKRTTPEKLQTVLRHPYRQTGV